MLSGLGEISVLAQCLIWDGGRVDRQSHWLISRPIEEREKAAAVPAAPAFQSAAIAVQPSHILSQPLRALFTAFSTSNIWDVLFWSLTTKILTCWTRWGLCIVARLHNLFHLFRLISKPQLNYVRCLKAMLLCIMEKDKGSRVDQMGGNLEGLRKIGGPLVIIFSPCNGSFEFGQEMQQGFL